MNGSGPDAECFSCFEDARTGRQLCPDTLDDIVAHRTATEPLPLCPAASETEIYPASDNRTLIFRKCACDLEQQAACRRRGVDVLLIEVKVDPNRFQVLDRAEKVGERAPNPIYRPCHHEIEPTPVGVLEHPIECRALVSAFRTADPEILIDLGDLPSTTLGDPFQFEPLVDFLFLEPRDVPDAVGGFSRIGSGFQHNRTRIAVDIFTPSSINIPRDVAEQVIRTVSLSNNIRVASASGLVALKLFRSSMRDKADIVALLKTGHVDLAGWPLSPEMLAAFEALVEVARTDPA
jgi:hypothetical protein